MNKMDRVRAALNDAPVDRVPASFWYHFPPDRMHGESAVRAHVDYFRQSGIDFLKVMNEHPVQANLTIREPADWRAVRPAPLTAPFYQAMLDELKAILDVLGGECLVIVTVFGPFASGNHASGDLVTSHLRVATHDVSLGLAAIAESLAGFAQACIETGASGIYYSAQGGEEDRFTEDQFLEFIKPHDLTVLEAVRGRGEFNVLHVCRDRVRLHLYADYPSHAVNWAATKHNPSLAQGRDIFRRTVIGGLDDRGVIATGPREEIQTAVQAVIRDFGPTGLIIGADCTVPTDIPLDHIRAAVEATALPV
jgi:uroporphyrinogen decarboxylase